MRQLSKRKAVFSQNTTKMVRIVISGAKKSSSPQENFLSLLWLLGAALVIIVYIVIPLLIALHQIPNMVFELLLAAVILFSAELIVSLVLLKIARPSSTPSVLPKHYQSKQHFPVPAQPPQLKMPSTNQLAPSFQPPSTLIPTSIPTSQFAKLRSLRPLDLPSFPTIEGRATAVPRMHTQLPQKLKLPTRSQ